MIMITITFVLGIVCAFYIGYATGTSVAEKELRNLYSKWKASDTAPRC